MIKDFCYNRFMITTTLPEIQKYQPHPSYLATIFQSLNKKDIDNVPIPLEYLLNIGGLDLAVWALRAIPGRERAFRILACCVANSVLSVFEDIFPEQKALRLAIVTARRMAEGLATPKEIEVARVEVRYIASGLQRNTSPGQVDGVAMALNSAVWCGYHALEETAYEATEMALRNAAWVSWFCVPKNCYADLQAANMAVLKARQTHSSEFRRMCRGESPYVS